MRCIFLLPDEICPVGKVQTPPTGQIHLWSARWSVPCLTFGILHTPCTHPSLHSRPLGLQFYSQPPLATTPPPPTPPAPHSLDLTLVHACCCGTVCSGTATSSARNWHGVLSVGRKDEQRLKIVRNVTHSIVEMCHSGEKPFLLMRLVSSPCHICLGMYVRHSRCASEESIHLHTHRDARDSISFAWNLQR